jgi:hypothetical protein
MLIWHYIMKQTKNTILLEHMNSNLENNYLLFTNNYFLMKPSTKQITAIHNRYLHVLIESYSKLIDFMDSRNLRWPLIFSCFCFFSFWSELVNYHYYKYFTKVLVKSFLIVGTYGCCWNTHDGSSRMPRQSFL